MKLADLSPQDRPRERLEQAGVQALSTAELLALILKSGTKNNSIMELCQKLLAKYSLPELSTITLAALCNEEGIGTAKACQIIAVGELARRLQQPSERRININNPRDIAELYSSRLRSQQKEYFLAVYLDTKNKIIADEVVTIGILNASLIHPREVFHGALKHLAHSLIVLHNHPSGDPTPSTEDLDVTKQLARAGTVMGIELVDHLIIGNDCYWSWRESNRNNKL